MQDPIFTYYQELARQYDKARFGSAYGRYIHRQEFQFLTEQLSQIPTGQALELACGTGRLLAFADTGLDFSPNMLELARERWPDKTLVQADATAIPFPDGHFKAIYTLHFIMHLSKGKTREVLEEAYRVLEPGGLLICDFPSYRRRRLTGGHRTGHWHASNSFSLAGWQDFTAENWKLRDWQGVLFFPIHRIPLRLRWQLRRTDDWFCRHFFKEFASYLLVCMQKR